MEQVLMKVENLKKYYPIKGGVFNKTVGYVHAVETVDFEVKKRETFSLVGESGCGKSTTGRSIIRIEEPTAGEILFNGIDILKYDKEQIRKLRKDMQMIFQNPYSSLNPRMKIGDLLSEPLFTHTRYTRKEISDNVENMLEKVGLAVKYKDRYPHQFSGGQRQRISIARALMTNPSLVVADEPVSALDVSIQAQIINLLMKLQDDLELTYIFISHDLNVVRHISTNVGVMYLGRIIEKAETEELFNYPCHPYTKALLSAVPSLKSGKKKERIILSGDVPSPINPPNGCAFHLRCKYTTEKCKIQVPEYKEIRSGHFAACHLL